MIAPILSDEDAELEKLEDLIPALAERAFSAAHQRALEMSAKDPSLEVLVSGDYDGHGYGLYQAFADGRHRFIKPLPAPVEGTKGLRFRLSERGLVKINGK